MFDGENSRDYLICADCSVHEDILDVNNYDFRKYKQRHSWPSHRISYWTVHHLSKRNDLSVSLENVHNIQHTPIQTHPTQHEQTNIHTLGLINCISHPQRSAHSHQVLFIPYGSYIQLRRSLSMSFSKVRATDKKCMQLICHNGFCFLWKYTLIARSDVSASMRSKKGPCSCGCWLVCFQCQGISAVNKKPLL